MAVPDPDWLSDAPCKGVPLEWFFNERLTHKGKAICKTCPFREECLQFGKDLASSAPGLGGHLQGVFGGVSYADIKKNRKAAHPAAPSQDGRPF